MGEIYDDNDKTVDIVKTLNKLKSDLKNDLKNVNREMGLLAGRVYYGCRQYDVWIEEYKKLLARKNIRIDNCVMKIRELENEMSARVCDDK